MSSIFARLSACRYTMRYISVIPVACHPSISAERTVKRGSRGANLIYLSQVPSASPPFLLPFAPRGSSTWYPWYTCISFSAPLRRFLCLSPLRCLSSNQILPLSFSLVPSSITYRSPLFNGVPCKEGRKEGAAQLARAISQHGSLFLFCLVKADSLRLSKGVERMMHVRRATGPFFKLLAKSERLLWVGKEAGCSSKRCSRFRRL